MIVEDLIVIGALACFVVGAILLWTQLERWIAESQR